MSDQEQIARLERRVAELEEHVRKHGEALRLVEQAALRQVRGRLPQPSTAPLGVKY